ncbi:MAG: ribosomal protein S19 family protein, partial [Thermoplasmata archaeon]
MAKGRKGKKVEARRKREFSFRGLSLPRLKEMSLEELAQILPARARRSIRRGFTVEAQRFLERMRETPTEKVVRTHTRDAMILPEHVGRRVAVHNGKEYK